MDKTPPLKSLLEFAVGLARQAGEITLEYFQSARLRVDWKADATPVTEADRRVEQFIRERIAAAFPGHAIMGEEFGESAGGSAAPRPGEAGRPPYRWIIDPIDGTKSFIHGVPLYGVMIALEVEGAAALGVLRFPALNETVAAAAGCGCFFNDAPCRVTRTAKLAEATALSSGVAGFRTVGRWAAFEKVVQSVRLFRTWGDCYGHALVASGRADIMIDPVAETWDAAPLLPIVTEAGGRFTDLAGQPTIYGRSGISTNGLLHAEVLEMLKG